MTKLDDLSLKRFFSIAIDRGFIKKGQTLHRNLGETQQIIVIQLSHGNSVATKTFYINIGIGFNRLWENPEVKRWKIEDYHYSRRIREFLREAPDSWTIDSTTKNNDTEKSLGELSNDLINSLNTLDRVQSVLPLLKKGSELILAARLYYSQGEYKNAMANLESAATFFSDRKGMSVPEMIDRFHLHELKHLLASN